MIYVIAYLLVGLIGCGYRTYRIRKLNLTEEFLEWWWEYKMEYEFALNPFKAMDSSYNPAPYPRPTSQPYPLHFCFMPIFIVAFWPLIATYLTGRHILIKVVRLIEGLVPFYDDVTNKIADKFEEVLGK